MLLIQNEKNWSLSQPTRILIKALPIWTALGIGGYFGAMVFKRLLALKTCPEEYLELVEVSECTANEFLSNFLPLANQKQETRTCSKRN